MAENTVLQNSKQPRAHRYESMAHIRIHGFDGHALIRNINRSGFCIASKTYVAISRNETHKMELVPEGAASVSSIAIDVEVRWTRTTEKNFAAGLSIVRGAGSLNAYLSYLEKMRGSGKK
ncbi:MAG: hypothetical protein LBC88_08140 [Spirochaetaceae bacterium]|jgi:hypothetical protein|nr:hypothetical protein [Spirochaetaceae bacterium]